MTQTEQREGIERGQTYSRIPFNDKLLRFAQPMIQGTYVNVGKAILSSQSPKLRLPTGEERAFELDRVYNSEDAEFRESPEADAVRDNMKNNHVWVFNRNIWTSESARNPGLYVVFDSQAQGISAPFDLTELEDKLSGGTTERGVRFSKDGTIRFAPRNTFYLGTQKGALADSGFVIANYGIEGAKKLDKVAPKVGMGKPYIYGVSGNSEPIQKVAALGHDWGLDGGLGLGGGWDDDYLGFASGVRVSAE